MMHTFHILNLHCLIHQNSQLEISITVYDIWLKRNWDLKIRVCDKDSIPLSPKKTLLISLNLLSPYFSGLMIFPFFVNSYRLFCTSQMYLKSSLYGVIYAKTKTFSTQTFEMAGFADLIQRNPIHSSCRENDQPMENSSVCPSTD